MVEEIPINEELQSFADTYFDRMTTQKIGFVRDDIEARFNNQEVNERERAMVVTSLIYAMDRISHTCGHYDSFSYSSISQSSMFPLVESKLMPTFTIGLPQRAKRWA